MAGPAVTQGDVDEHTYPYKDGGISANIPECDGCISVFAVLFTGHDVPNVDYVGVDNVYFTTSCCQVPLPGALLLLGGGLVRLMGYGRRKRALGVKDDTLFFMRRRAR